MRFNLVAGILVLGAALALVLSASCPASADEHVEQSQQLRLGFSMPKLFDFANYKRLFNKKYASPIEELARQKLFLARAWRAFISAAKYRWNMATKWMAINHFSDKTPEQLRRMASRKGQLYSFRRDAPVERPKVAEPEQQVPAASIEDIARELDAAEKHRDEPGYKQLAEQLDELAAIKRSKREAHESLGGGRQLTLSDLVHAPVAQEPEPQGERVASNNPTYRPPELDSQAAVGEQTEESLVPAEASYISRLPGAGFISSLTGELTRRFAGSHPKGLRSKTAEQELAEQDVELQVERVGKLAKNDEMLIDHRRSGCFFKPRNQGDCGSCFIFSTIAMYEWMHCRDTGNLVAFSEQYPIDCGARLGIQGCDGGQEREVGDFVREFGIELRANYPYHQKVDTCPYDENEDPDVMGYLKLKGEQGLHTIGFRKLEEVLKESPIMLGFAQYDAFFEYGGGVDNPDPSECRDDQGHSMLLVGMGREDGHDYWLFRNSYNVDWGDNGYYKLSKDSDCLMDGYGWTSKGQFTWKDSVTTNPNYASSSRDARRQRRHHE